MADESVKVQMFRFVDVLPMLRTHEAITRICRSTSTRSARICPGRPARSGDLAAELGLGKALALNARTNALRMSQRFIAGTKSKKSWWPSRKLRKQGFAFTLDLLGEATTSERDAEAYQRAYIDLIGGLAREVQSWPEVAAARPRSRRPHPARQRSLKLSALYSQFRPVDPAGTAEHVKERLRPLLRAAREHDAYVHVDMEQYAYKDLTFEIFKEILMEDEFRDFPTSASSSGVSARGGAGH